MNGTLGSEPMSYYDHMEAYTIQITLIRDPLRVLHKRSETPLTWLIEKWTEISLVRMTEKKRKITTYDEIKNIDESIIYDAPSP